MKYQYDDGGRVAAGYQGQAGDCTTRAIAIATGLSYQTVYNALNAMGREERFRRPGKTKSSARTGVRKTTIRKYLAGLGWTWHPTMRIGSGCTVHLADKELTPGRLIVSVSRHTVAVVDGVIHDTYDPSRSGTRCVYGYYTPTPTPKGGDRV